MALDRLSTFSTSYPTFYQHLKTVASGLDQYRTTAGVPIVIDDHQSSDGTLPITMIGICYLHDQSGQLLSQEIDNHRDYPNAWCFYLTSNVRSQCKNPLYVSETKVHITTRATGADITKSEIQDLHGGKLLSQPRFRWMEYTFALPVEEFISALK
jgi:hypothetical protein